MCVCVCVCVCVCKDYQFIDFRNPNSTKMYLICFKIILI